jgi:hypothetical protein
MIRKTMNNFVVALVVLVSTTQGFGQEAECFSMEESTGAVTTVCDNGDGTSTFTVDSGLTDSPGACKGAPNSCSYSYVA